MYSQEITMLKLTENDLKIFFGEVIRNVAKKLKIKKLKWRFDAELLEKIKAKNETVSEKLEEFFVAYKKWHKVHVKASPENIEGVFSTDDSYELKTLVSVRNAARKALLKELSQRK
jgi:predicted transcriptional regulator